LRLSMYRAPVMAPSAVVVSNVMPSPFLFKQVSSQPCG
jgi:hypothetical protein